MHLPSTHEQRVELGQELARRLLARHGQDAIIAVGAHGSVARGDDGASSDLDLAVVTAGPEVEVPSRTLRYQGVIVDIGAISAEAYLEEAEQIGPVWPLAADQYVHTLPLHDPSGFFPQLRSAHEAAVQAAPAEAFAAAAGLDLAELLSWQGKAEQAEIAGDPVTAMVAVKEAAVCAALAVGLLTRTPYRNVGHALHATATAAATPPQFRDAFRRLLAPGAEPATAVIDLARAATALLAMAEGNDVRVDTDDLSRFVE